jgi:formylglycine-generating enzyme required for sulfatase activity
MTERKTTYRIFISSTYLDNAERRKVVEDAVLRADMQPVGMERFTASARPTVEECERLARECDVYVGIIAHRYGWIPDGHDRSITELEYDAAKKAERTRFMFQIESGLSVFPDKDFDEGDDRWKKQEKLQEFRARYGKDQMPTPFTDTTLGTKVLHALNSWKEEQKGSSEASGRQRGAAPQDDGEIARYCQAVETLHAMLELVGFKTQLRVPIDLEELYVPLHAMIDLRGVGEAAFADAAEAEKRLRELQAGREIPLVEAFREAYQRKRRGLVILGEPGSGKTTHLKRLLLWCLREGAAGSGLPSDILPLFLPLRELRDLSQGLEAFIEQQLDSPHLGMGEGFGTRLMKRGRLLLLFDGLDEVSDVEHRAQVARWIEAAIQARPSCTPVVTCRFAGYGGDARLGPQFLELHLRPLTGEESEAFIRNWYHAVETGLAVEPAQGEVIARTRAEELIGSLGEHDFRSARMVAMTRNPLLLANLCLVHRDRGGLPRGRARLYDECIEVLLERWRESKKLPVTVTAEIGRRILQPAALWLHGVDQRVRASSGDLAPVLEPALKAVQWKGGSAEAFLRTVRDESGLLTGWGHDEYGLMHLGFQEYLAACEVRRRTFEGEAEVLRDLACHYGESWWQEVILMLLAVGNPSLFTPFMREVVKLPAFAHAAELLDLILEEAAEATETPFIELVKQPAGSDPELWARQMKGLRVLERLRREESLQELMGRLARHPFPELQRWLADRRMAAGQDIRVIPNGGVELVLIPGGSFLMGSPESEKGRSQNEGPSHEVKVSPFYLGRYPVTNEEYARFLEANPGMREPAYWSDRRFNRARQPVVGVSWDDAVSFAQWAGGRLPTEAEWEYAARAGSQTRWFFGDDEDELPNYAWYDQNAGGQTQDVGQKQPNAWGLHDTHGNVWEWVEDCWHENYKSAPDDGSAWLEKEGGNCGLRVIRGGSWGDGPRSVRSALRYRSNRDGRYYGVGFRLAQDIQ